MFRMFMVYPCRLDGTCLLAVCLVYMTLAVDPQNRIFRSVLWRQRLEPDEKSRCALKRVAKRANFVV